MSHHSHGAVPTHRYTATMELDLARTYAASLHLQGPSDKPNSQASRLALVLECCAAARQAALIGNLPELVTECDDLLSAVDAALLPVAQLAA